MDRKNIEKIAKTSEDKILLAKVWDKINSGLQKNIMTNTCFLSLRELDMTHYLFGDAEGLTAYGGYADAERKMLVYLPDYLDESILEGDDSPLVCIHASFYEGDTPSHRDFLGALMGTGIARETVGDILVGKGSCDFFITAEIAPYLLQNFDSAGRTKIQLKKMSVTGLKLPTAKIVEIRDTLVSARLDSIVSAGFRISRSKAVEYIHNSRATVNGLPCEKPDKTIDEGATVTVRGLGKINVCSIGSPTKKGRIPITIYKYV